MWIDNFSWLVNSPDELRKNVNFFVINYELIIFHDLSILHVKIYNYFVLALFRVKFDCNSVQSYVPCIICGFSLYGLCVRESVKT